MYIYYNMYMYILYVYVLCNIYQGSGEGNVGENETHCNANHERQVVGRADAPQFKRPIRLTPRPLSTSTLYTYTNIYIYTHIRVCVCVYVCVCVCVCEYLIVYRLHPCISTMPPTYFVYFVVNLRISH